MLGQKLVFGFHGKTLPEEFKNLLREYKIGNVILFLRNVESAEQLRALCAEIQSLVLEETGYTLSRYSNPRIYDVMVQEGGQDFAVHHIMAFYDIVLDFERSQKSLPQEVLDGSNDSANAIWIPFEQITEKNASPLVLKVKAELVGFPELELTSYINWKTKEG